MYHRVLWETNWQRDFFSCQRFGGKISYVHTIIPSHSYSTFIRRHSSRFLYLLIAGQWSAHWENPPWGAEPRIELGPAIDSKPIHYQLRYAAPYWATPHPIEQRRTLVSYAAPCWATSHPAELCRTLTELPVRRTLTELRHTLLSYLCLIPSFMYKTSSYSTIHYNLFFLCW